MGRTPIYTPEERKERRRITQARYRLKQGIPVGMPPGPRPKDEVRYVADWSPRIVVSQKKQTMIMPKSKLNANSSVEDVREWIVEVCARLSECDNPSAWASAAAIMQRNLELLIKLTPPPQPEHEPRPRITIELDDKDEICD